MYYCYIVITSGYEDLHKNMKYIGVDECCSKPVNTEKIGALYSRLVQKTQPQQRETQWSCFRDASAWWNKSASI